MKTRHHKASTQDGRQERVLVLSSEVRGICDLLDGEGYRATHCHDVAELYDQLESAGAGAVVIDGESLGRVYREVLDVLRRQPRWSDLPLIVLVDPLAPPDAEMINAVSEAGRRVAFLQKPVQVQTFVNVVNGSLRARRRQYDVRDVLGELKSANTALTERTVALQRANEALQREMDARLAVSAQLAESQRQLQTVMDAAPAAIVYVDSEQRYRYCNSTYLRLRGLDPSVIGRPIREVLSPETYESVRSYVERCLAGHDVVYETTIVERSGQKHHMVAAYAPDIDQAGEVRGLVAVLNDITDQKRVEIALQDAMAQAQQRAREAAESSQILQAMMEHIPLGIMIVDGPEMHIRMVSRFGMRTTDHDEPPPHELTLAQQMGQYSLLYPETLTPVPYEDVPLVRAVRENQVQQQVELIVRSSQGEMIPVLASAAPICDSAGRVTGGVVAWQDITDRKKWERALRDSEENYRSLVQAAGSIILRIDRTGRVTFFNEYAQKFFGFGEHEVLGRSVFETIVPPTESTGRSLRSLINDVVAHAEQYEYNENENVRKDGQRVWVAWSNRPLLGPDGQVQEILSVGTDITSRKVAEEELRRLAAELSRSNQELEQFASIASHDLQEPLRMVIGYLDLLEDRAGDQLDAESNQYMQVAVDGAQRMQTLIRDLLAYARVGTRGREFGPTDCNQAANQALANLQASIDESRALIHLDPLPTVWADESQIVQLFQNLLSNAIKFHGDAPPDVFVGAERQADGWLLFVRDHGIGIAPQYIERIFQVFQRLHTRKEYPGTGIGLALCKKIVERHGGQMCVESQEGKGSTFFFTLPDRGG